MLDRRDFLRMSASLSVSFALPGLSPRAAARRGTERSKSLILVWLEGGPSQLETWDPHPGSAVGGPTRSIATKIPGARIAEYFPQLAEQIHRLSIVRSLVSKEGDHQRGSYLVRTGFRPDPTVRHPSLGSIVSKELPATGLEIPAFVSLGFTSHPSAGGYLGGEYNAFQGRDPGTISPNFRAGVPEERLDQRVKNLNVLSRSFRQGRGPAVEQTLHQKSVEAALRMMTSEQQKAFEIAEEPDAIKRAYGDTVVGRGCLVARRLIEQGVRVVEVTMTGFDSHQDNFGTHARLASELDPALAMLLHELESRDLMDSTVVMCMGEFGRTPRINGNAGRDHWPDAFSGLVGGGGIRAGQLLGATDPTGKEKKPADPVEIQDLYATVLRALGVRHDQMNMTNVGRPMKYSDGQLLKTLLSEPEVPSER